MSLKIALRKGLSIGTLGPEATSSNQALVYFIETLSEQMHFNYQKNLYDTFEDCYSEILAGRIDLALVPSAYEDITKFFWNPI